MDDIETERHDVDTSRRTPHAVYLTGEDNLRVTVFNAAAGVTVTIRGRYLPLDGDIVPFSDSFVPATNRTASTNTTRLAEGWLLGVSVFVSGGSPLTGQTFAIVSLIRGEGTSAIDLMTLAAGPVTASQRIGYPGSLIMNSLDGAGALRLITGTTPGAGAEISETVPTGARWQLLSFAATIATSAAAANRQPTLVIDDGATQYQLFPQAATTPASNSSRYFWTAGSGVFLAQLNGADVQGLVSPLWLLAGHRIRTLTTLIQAGDQWSAVLYGVREWMEAA